MKGFLPKQNPSKWFLCFALLFSVHFVKAVEQEEQPSKVKEKFARYLRSLDESSESNNNYRRIERKLTRLLKVAPNYRDVHFHLALIQIHLGCYEPARFHLSEVLKYGGTYAKQHILWLERKVNEKLESSFLALCHGGNIKLPLSPREFKFSIAVQYASISEQESIVLKGGLYADTLWNIGFISAPIIWVKNPQGFYNGGKIDTQLLVVGHEEVNLIKQTR